MRLPLLFLLVFLTSMSAQAQDTTFAPDDMRVRDSVDYMLDDGIMSRAEMENEANYIHATCASNGMQSQYYNCDCIAGAFLIRREKLGPLVPQSKIYGDIMANARGECINTARIAGGSYAHCMEFSAVHRELATDNEQYCRCVANRAARTFAQRPLFDTMYVTSIDENAMDWCADPRNRPYGRRAAAN